MPDTPAHRAVRLGFLRFPPPGETFPGRSGVPKHYLVDARGAAANVELRALLVDALVERLSVLGSPQAIGGVAKSGTVWGLLLAWRTHLPFANVLLDGPRTTGLQRQVEGEVRGLRVVLVDNWLRTGISLRQAADLVTAAGGVVDGALVLVSTGSVQHPFKVEPVWPIEELLLAAKDEGLVGPSTPLYTDMYRHPNSHEDPSRT